MFKKGNVQSVGVQIKLKTVFCTALLQSTNDNLGRNHLRPSSKSNNSLTQMQMKRQQNSLKDNHLISECPPYCSKRNSKHVPSKETVIMDVS